MPTTPVVGISRDSADTTSEREPMNTTIQDTPRRRFLFNLFSMAMEGGVSYWGRVIVYRWVNQDTGVEVDGLQHVDLDGFYAIVHDHETGDLRVDAATIEKGLAHISTTAGSVNKYMRGRIAGANITEEIESLDADDADAIVQAGLFGSVVYG
jgi:hypothetical protein